MGQSLDRIKLELLSPCSFDDLINRIGSIVDCKRKLLCSRLCQKSSKLGATLNPWYPISGYDPRHVLSWLRRPAQMQDLPICSDI